MLLSQYESCSCSDLLIPQYTQESVLSFFPPRGVKHSWSQDPVKEPDRENAEFVSTSFQMLSCTNTTQSNFYNMLI